MNTPKPKRDAVALWKAIQDSALDDEIEEIASMSDEELDASIRADGGDPAAIRARGEAFVAELIAQREQTKWHGEMHAKLAAFRADAAASRTTTPLPREEILRRLDEARRDPRFSGPVAALFRQKTLEESTDAELQALVDQIALLAKLEAK